MAPKVKQASQGLSMTAEIHCHSCRFALWEPEGDLAQISSQPSRPQGVPQARQVPDGMTAWHHQFLMTSSPAGLAGQQGAALGKTGWPQPSLASIPGTGL